MAKAKKEEKVQKTQKAAAKKAPAKAVKAPKEPAFSYDEEYIEGIIGAMEATFVDFRKGLTVASAAKRARLATNALAKTFKAYRANSVNAFRK